MPEHFVFFTSDFDNVNAKFKTVYAAINLADLCKAIGVPNVLEINAFDIETLEKTLKQYVTI